MPTATRTRSGAVALTLAGVLFVLYQAVAPRADETTMAGARAWADYAWVLSHVSAIVGFVLISLGLLALHQALADTRVERLGFRTMVIGWVGVGLLLPYYGAEVYGLNALGKHVAASGDTALLGLSEDFRMDATAVAMFVTGLALVGLAGILAAVAVWRSGRLNRWTGIPLAVALATLIPQYFVPQPVRIGHGVVVAIGAVTLAAALWRAAPARER